MRTLDSKTKNKVFISASIRRNKCCNRLALLIANTSYQVRTQHTVMQAPAQQNTCISICARSSWSQAVTFNTLQFVTCALWLVDVISSVEQVSCQVRYAASSKSRLYRYDNSGARVLITKQDMRTLCSHLALQRVCVSRKGCILRYDSIDSKL